MKAYLKNYRMSPRKVRLVADAVKNKNVQVADVELSFMPKKAARTIRTLIRSAVSNAVNNEGMNAENLVVKSVQVNQGMTLKRWRARARGAAFPINKRTSNISVELAEKAEKKTAQKKEETKKVETKAAKKPATKKTAQKETK
jgi:large subunit ribosomal protein L22